MRVLMVSAAFQPAWDWGGPVRSMWNLARGLAALQVEVTVLTTNARQKGIVAVPPERTEEGVRILTAPVMGGGNWEKANRHGISPALWKMVVSRVRETELVHFNGLLTPTTAIGGAVSRFLGKPYVISTRANLEDRSLDVKRIKKELAFRFGLKRVLNGVSALHFTTEMERDLSPQWARGINSIVVPNPIEMPAKTGGAGLRRKYGIANDALLLGIVGRLHQRKGFDVLLPALSKVATTRDICLLVVGPNEGSYKRELERTIIEEKLNERVFFTSELSGKELDSAYAEMDVLVSPSHGESFGNVVVEAAVQGTPCIVSDQVGLKDWVEKNEVGLVLPLEMDTWAEVISGLEKKELASRWNSDRIEKLARESFSIDRVARQMLEQYEGILSKERR
jgi:glycosyltransferase involved in cell wall biosynthesis